MSQLFKDYQSTAMEKAAARRWLNAPDAPDYQRHRCPFSFAPVGSSHPAAAGHFQMGSCVRPKLPRFTSDKFSRTSAPLSLRVRTATRSASLMSSPCTPDVVGGSFTPGGVFDDADDEWDGLPITPAGQLNETLTMPDSDAWCSGSGICSNKSVASSCTTLPGLTSPNAQMPPRSSEDNILWPQQCRMDTQVEHMLASEAKPALGLVSHAGCNVTTETILRNVGGHQKVEADGKLRTSCAVPDAYLGPNSDANVDRNNLEACDAGDEFIVVSALPRDADVQATETAKTERLGVTTAQALAHDIPQSSVGGNLPSPCVKFGCDHDVKPCHPTFHSGQQPSSEICDAVTSRIAADISTPTSDEFPVATSFLPANFFDDDLDAVDSSLLGNNYPWVNDRQPVGSRLNPADGRHGTVGQASVGRKSMIDSTCEGVAPSSAWQWDFTHGSVNPVPELVSLSPAAAALFKVLGIATEPSTEAPVPGSKKCNLTPSDLATEANVVSSPLLSSSEEGDCLPSLSSIQSSRVSLKSEKKRDVAHATQPAVSSAAATVTDTSLLVTNTALATGRPEPVVPQARCIPHHLNVAAADSDFRHLLGHWLAAYVIGRLAHRESVGAGNIAADWSRPAVQARELERVGKVVKPEAEYSFFSPRPTPRAVDRTSGRFAGDPYGVLKRHGIVSAAPNTAFVQIVTDFIVRRRIPAETIVAAAWFVDNLPVHEVDEELGFHFRGSLCTSNGEPFAIERRLAMIALYLADMSISDFNYNLVSWSNAFGVPKANAVRIEREALASLGYSVSIPIQSWRDHCKNVYSLFTRATYLTGVSTLSLGTMHAMVVTARGAAEDAALDMQTFCQRQKADLACEAISTLRDIQSTIDTSGMPVATPRLNNRSVYHTPASDQENVAPPTPGDCEYDEDEFAPYDGAPSFPAPVFAKKTEPPTSMLPTPPYDGADSFPEPAFEDNKAHLVHRAVSQSNALSLQDKVVEWLHQEPEDEDEDENSYEEYDGAVPFPDPVPVEPKVPKYSMSIQVEASSLACPPSSAQTHGHASKRARYASSPRHNPAASWPLDSNLAPSQIQQERYIVPQQRMPRASLSSGYSSNSPQDRLQLKSLSAQPIFFSEGCHYLTRAQLRSLAVEHHPRPIRAPCINGVATECDRVAALEAAIGQGRCKDIQADGHSTERTTYGIASQALLPTLITALINAAAELEPLKKASEPVTSATIHQSTMATVA